VVVKDEIGEAVTETEKLAVAVKDEIGEAVTETEEAAVAVKDEIVEAVTHKDQIASLQKDLSEARADGEAKAKDFLELKVQLEGMQKEMSALQNSFTEEQEACNKLRAEQAATREELEAVQKKHDALAEELSAKARTEETAAAELTVVKRELAASKTHGAEMEAALGVAQKASEAAREAEGKEIEDLKRQVQGARAELVAAQEQLAEEQKRSAVLAEEKTSVQEELTVMNVKQLEVAEQAAFADAANRKAEHEISELRDRLAVAEKASLEASKKTELELEEARKGFEVSLGELQSEKSRLEENLVMKERELVAKDTAHGWRARYAEEEVVRLESEKKNLSVALQKSQGDLSRGLGRRLASMCCAR